MEWQKRDGQTISSGTYLVWENDKPVVKNVPTPGKFTDGISHYIRIEPPKKEVQLSPEEAYEKAMSML